MSIKVGGRAYAINTSLNFKGALMLSENANAPVIDESVDPPATWSDFTGPDGAKLMATTRVSMPIDQGACGSCYVVATVLHLRDAFASHDRTFTPELSPLCVLMNTTGGCGGGTPVEANMITATQGVFADSLLPYEQYKDGLAKSKTRKKIIAKMRDIMKSQVPLYRSHANVSFVTPGTLLKTRAGCDKVIRELKQYIVTYGSVLVGIPMHKDFATYWNRGDKAVPYAIDEGPSNAIVGGHLIAYVGWGTTGEGVDYWVIRNSWGRDTGPYKNGFGRVAMFYAGGDGGRPEYNRKLFTGMSSQIGGHVAIHPRDRVFSSRWRAPTDTFALADRGGPSPWLWASVLLAVFVAVAAAAVLAARRRRRFD